MNERPCLLRAHALWGPRNPGESGARRFESSPPHERKARARAMMGQNAVVHLVARDTESEEVADGAS
ncbi:MAG: hypothetical protein KatS3mg013_0713 [Actinomycetota bacterium]|jgi:hypothetical protein|nr:MAG: hypothetical protein KatS3mg013_0713 [Actinomycetota bacterium]